MGKSLPGSDGGDKDHLKALFPERFRNGSEEEDVRRIVQINPDFLSDSHAFWLSCVIFCQLDFPIVIFCKSKINGRMRQAPSGFSFLKAWPKRAMTLVKHGAKSSEA